MFDSEMSAKWKCEDTMSTHATPGTGSSRRTVSTVRPRSVSHSRYRRAFLAVMCAVAGAAPFVVPSAAAAGSFTIGDCPSASNGSTATGPLQVFGQTPQTLLKTECNGNPSALYFAIRELPETPVGFRLTTNGTHLTILTARIWWRAFGSPSGAVEAETETTNADGEDLQIGVADGSGELFADMTSPEEFHFPASADATTLQLAEHCFPEAQCPMTESFGVGIEVFGAELTLNDELPPALSQPRIENEGSGALTGPVAVTFSGSDPDAGVERAELLLDGTPVATRDYRPECSFTQLRPCPGNVSGGFAGISLPEGGNELAVRLTDAAGNTTLSKVPPLANGAPCAGARLNLKADHRVGSRVTIPHAHGALIEGRLACGDTPVPGAAVQLTTAVVGAAPKNPISLITGADGTFRYHLPPGPSRRMSFSYRAYSDEATPAATGVLTVDVRPRLTLNIVPRSTHNHETIEWDIGLVGGPYPAAGIGLNLQVKEGRRWQTFDEITAHRAHLGYLYEFKRTTRPTTYSFRVALPPNGAAGYPYATGASEPVKVHVSP